MQITKKDIIQKLYEIEEITGNKLGREVQRVVRNETIPFDVIKIVNKYDNRFLQVYDTYNVIYNSRNKNPLFRNLRNKDLEISELAIAISSLVTKILISCSKITNEEERQLYATAMRVDELNEALTNYSIYNEVEPLVQCGKEVRELLHLLYAD